MQSEDKFLYCFLEVGHTHFLAQIEKHGLKVGNKTKIDEFHYCRFSRSFHPIFERARGLFVKDDFGGAACANLRWSCYGFSIHLYHGIRGLQTAGKLLESGWTGPIQLQVPEGTRLLSECTAEFLWGVGVLKDRTTSRTARLGLWVCKMAYMRVCGQMQRRVLAIALIDLNP